MTDHGVSRVYKVQGQCSVFDPDHGQGLNTIIALVAQNLRCVNIVSGEDICITFL